MGRREGASWLSWVMIIRRRPPPRRPGGRAARGCGGGPQPGWWAAGGPCVVGSGRGCVAAAVGGLRRGRAPAKPTVVSLRCVKCRGAGRPVAGAPQARQSVPSLPWCSSPPSSFKVVGSSCSAGRYHHRHHRFHRRQIAGWTGRKGNPPHRRRGSTQVSKSIGGLEQEPAQLVGIRRSGQFLRRRIAVRFGPHRSKLHPATAGGTRCKTVGP
jgi:hypothetical protein